MSGDEDMEFPFPILFHNAMQNQQHSCMEYPSRIKAAMDLLILLTKKSKDQVYTNGMGFETLPGQKLSQSEQIAQGAACQMLTNYFRVKKKRRRKPQSPGDNGQGLVLKCSNCHQHGSIIPDCRLCHGTGTVVCYPSCLGN